MDERALQPFLEQLRREAFRLDGPPQRALHLGAEVELLPMDAATGRLAAIDGGGVATLPVIRALGRRLGWQEVRSAKAGVPEHHTAGGGRLTFEPGGQIEYAAAPNESLSALVAELQEITTALRDALSLAGIVLVAAGIDPVNAIDDVPLQLSGDRYRRMDAHFAAIGRDGARMMRQTASIQISVDVGDEPLERWRLLNALAPYLVAIFANSRLYAGEDTGHQSIRRHIWGTLDPARTGVPYHEDDPVLRYARFAMHAGDILHGDGPPPYAPFAEALAQGKVGMDEWRAHLTTLFPEVRPRGYFEVRSVDALDPRWYAAPLVFLAGLVLDAPTARRAAALLDAPDAVLLARAGRCGLTDPRLATIARQLADLALAGCESLGDAFVSERDLDVARAFFARYTVQGRSPASDTLAPSAV